MCTRVSEWLHEVSSTWVTLAALVVLLLFVALVLPREAARSELETGGAGVPDLSFTYSADDLYRMAEAYGAQGRRAYVRARFTFDLVWPLVYAAFLTTALSWLYGRAFAAGSRWRMANLVPWLGALLDYLENVSTSLVIGRYPLRTSVVAHMAPLFTTAKWVSVGGSGALLVVGVVAYVLHLRQRGAR